MQLDISKFGLSSASFKKHAFEVLEERVQTAYSDRTPSDLNTGTIGLTLDLLGSLVEDVMFNVNLKAKEAFVNLAKLDNSIYMHANTRRVFDIWAKPASIDILLAVNKKDIIANAKLFRNGGVGGVYHLLKISRDSIVNVGGFDYLLDYPIHIHVKHPTTPNAAHIISSGYDLTINNPFSKVNTTYIQTTTQMIGKKEYYIMKLRCSQLRKDRSEHNIQKVATKSDVFSVNYIGELAGIQVSYKANQNAETILLKGYYNESIILEDSETFYYYELTRDELTGTGSVSVLFSSFPSHFYPVTGGKVIIDIFTTHGTRGNFEYNVNAPITIKFLQDIADIYQEAVNTLEVIPQLLTNRSVGGVNMKNVEELRKDIYRMNASRKVIISDDDLLQLMEDYDIKINKVRDDMIRREFSTFLLVKDSSRGFIVPSRNAELVLPTSSLIPAPEVNAYFVDPSTVFKLWLGTDNHKNYNRFTPEKNLAGLTEDDYIGDILKQMYNDTTYSPDLENLYNAISDETHDGMIMMCPFYLKIFKDPYTLGVYKLFNSGIYGTTFRYNDVNAMEKFSVSALYFDRSDVYKKSYNISIDISVTDTLWSEIQGWNPTDPDPRGFPVKIRIEMLDSEDKPIHFFDLFYAGVNEKKPELLIFETELVTDDILHDQDMIRIINGEQENVFTGETDNCGVMPLKDKSWPVENGTYPGTIFIPFQTKFNIHVLTNKNEYIVDYDDIYKNYLLTTMEYTNGYTITDEFYIDDVIYFVKSYSELFNSAINITKTNGVFPKYTENVYARYTNPTFEVDPVTGDYITDPVTNLIRVKPGQDIGDLVKNAEGNPILIHQAGEDKIVIDNSGEYIYATAPEVTYNISNIPLVSLISMMSQDHKFFIYDLFERYASYTKEIIQPRLINNDKLTMSVFNTIGRSSLYVKGNYTNFTELDNIDISLGLNIKVVEKSYLQDESLRTSISQYVENFIVEHLNAGLLSMSKLLVGLKNTYSMIDYIEFVRLNQDSSDIQTIKLAEGDSTGITPEHITIRYLLDKSDFISGKISLKPDITIKFL